MQSAVNGRRPQGSFHARDSRDNAAQTTRCTGADQPGVPGQAGAASRGGARRVGIVSDCGGNDEKE